MIKNVRHPVRFILYLLVRYQSRICNKQFSNFIGLTLKSKMTNVGIIAPLKPKNNKLLKMQIHEDIIMKNIFSYFWHKISLQFYWSFLTKKIKKYIYRPTIDFPL